MELNGCSHRTWTIPVLAVMQPEEVEVTACQWKIDSVKTLARGHLCNILAKNISYSGFSMRYWVGKSLKIIAWFVYFYSIYMYLFTFPIYIFIQNTFQLQPPPLSTLHSPSSLTPFHLPREWGPLEYPPNKTSQRSDKATKLGEQVGQTDNTLRDIPPLYLFQGPCEDWSTFTTYTVGPWPTLCLLFGWWVTLWESPSVQVSWLAGSSNRLPVPSQALNPFPQLFQKTPWALSNDRLWVSASFSQVLDGDSQRTVMLSYCLQV